MQAIEWLDSRLVSPLLARLEQAGEDCRILLLSDHKTLTATRGHDGDPVPFLIYDSRRDTGRGGVYDEPSGEAGLFVEDGSRLLDMLFDMVDEAKNAAFSGGLRPVYVPAGVLG